MSSTDGARLLKLIPQISTALFCLGVLGLYHMTVHGGTDAGRTTPVASPIKTAKTGISQHEIDLINAEPELRASVLETIKNFHSHPPAAAASAEKMAMEFEPRFAPPPPPAADGTPPKTRRSSASAAPAAKHSTEGLRDVLTRLFEKWGPKNGTKNHVLCSNFIEKFSVEPVRDREKMSFTSQCSEDWYLMSFFFDLERYIEKPGTYVDCAANHFAAKSNTFFFDLCLGWGGTCIEANPEYVDGLRLHRRCDVIDTCVSDKKETVTFVLDSEKSGISNAEYKFSGKKTHRPQITLECVPFEEALSSSRYIPKTPPTGVQYVDFLSLDVEGNEEKVLKGIDFDKTRFGVIIMEGSATDTKTQARLQSAGYVKRAMISGSYVFTGPEYDGFKGAEADKWSCSCRGCKVLEKR
mmetsp:Transcript_26037/g.65074  ORF Transcript_26037/g.65074 Transcript_26037/m.65074 type:complete len:410 (-) Transcript_26037:1146-2375(-)